MIQQINLYNPALRPRRTTFTAVHVVLLCTLAAIGMAGFWFYEHQVVSGLAADRRGVEKLLQAQRAHAERIARARAARLQGDTLEGEIARLEAKLKAQRAQLDTLQGGGTGANHGFAEYLRAFSRQALDGLWLTGFHIDADGEITIRGRALAARLVPQYIGRLDREKVLRGRSFAALDLARPDPASAPLRAGTTHEAAPFLEFSLATAEPRGGTGTEHR